MIKRLLIANRGEIACRIIRTAKRLGIHTIAIYSDIDRYALHVKMADQSQYVGPAAATESYLVIDNVLEAARLSSADAIHPGYGFLSENAGFARACEAAGIIFVGPGAAAMDAMASKSAAKKLMADSGVPVLPGYHGDAQDVATLKAEADRTGYPLMLKASAGGGGKGMRIVEEAADFEDSLVSVKREAKSSFGDDHVLFERYVTNPRHIEIQIFSDAHDNHVHLFERDCSIQRRHQKVLEEAPAPTITEQQRAQMGKAAVDAARAIKYLGAGTVEFIADSSGEFYFMEMNTRLQVEHPVTEMITGQDLVEWQLSAAAGEVLQISQNDLRIDGHSMEARIYAEDTRNGFLPASGKLEECQFPEASEYLRVETGVTAGDTVSVFYDPMIAKLVVWGEDRQTALKRLDQALAQTFIVGPATNVQYLRFLLNQPLYQSAEFDTGFIARLEPDDSEETQETLATSDSDAMILAAIVDFMGSADGGKEGNKENTSTRNWRLNTAAVSRAYWRHRYSENDSSRTLITISNDNDDIIASVDNTPVSVSHFGLSGNQLTAVIDDRAHEVIVQRSHSKFAIYPQLNTNPQSNEPIGKESLQVEKIDATTLAAENAAAQGSLLSPMPGKVIAVHVSAGDTVSKGDPLMVIEAMKMEHSINAPQDGTIETVCFAENDSVPEKAALLTMQE